MSVEKKETVLMVHNYYQIPGGEDTVVANEKKMLEDHGHKVVLYTRHNNELKNLSIFGKFLLMFRTIFNWRTYMDIRRIIREENIDIVHVHNTLPLISPAVYYAAISMKKPVIQTVHNFRLLCPAATFYRDGHICEECVEKGMLNAVKHGCYRDSKLKTTLCVVNMMIHHWLGIYRKIEYICLTDFNKTKLVEHQDINISQIFVKPNFIKTTENYNLRNGSVSYKGKKDRNYQFVYAGRLDKIKGVDILLEMWKKLGKRAPLLIVCGTGPLEDWCRNYVRTNNLNVSLRGSVTNENVKALLAESQAMILLTQCYEGFPISIVEAFSVGTPVICTDMGNVGDIVCNEINGFRINSFKDLSDIIYGITDIDIHESTYRSYMKNYSEEENYNLLSNIYEKMGKIVKK